MNRATNLICLASLAAVSVAYGALFYAVGLAGAGISHVCMGGVLGVLFAKELSRRAQ